MGNKEGSKEIKFLRSETAPEGIGSNTTVYSFSGTDLLYLWKSSEEDVNSALELRS